MNVAICVPSEGNPPETFINNHIGKLPFNITVIYGGYLPFITKGVQESTLLKLWFRVLNFVRGNKDNYLNLYQGYQLKKIFQYKRIDAVIAEYLIVGGYIAEICKKSDIPLIAIALGFDISVHCVINDNLIRYKFLFKYCSAIVVVSNHMRKRLHDLGCNDNKIVYSPAGPDDLFFKLTPAFKKKQIFALGRFVNKKAPHLAILAFYYVLKKDSNARLIYGGDGPLLEVCDDLVNALGIAKQVNFIGVISQEQQRNILEESTLFVQHSKVAYDGNSEGTPVSILEACAAGLPVVSTFHAGIPEVIENKVTGYLVAEGDVNGMSEYILKLLGDTDLAQNMGSAGKQYIAKNFSLNHHIELITGLLKKLQD